MITEHVLLHIGSGQEEAFERAFDQARTIIAESGGFRSLRLLRSTEEPSTYLLLVEWDQIEDHTDGFRRSPRYEEWRALLHHFYDPFPDVGHFATVAEVRADS